jgi:hypothetical protein
LATLQKDNLDIFPILYDLPEEMILILLSSMLSNFDKNQTPRQSKQINYLLKYVNVTEYCGTAKSECEDIETDEKL